MLTFQKALELINMEIQHIDYPKEPGSLYEPMAYLLTLNGKRIRPVFTLLACNLYKEDVNEAVPMAVAWEIFHNFTLMHDDVMDKAAMRRGNPTVHQKWNENTAILSGDAMLILAYMYLAKSSSGHLKSLLDLFSDTASGICQGQEYDMQFENRPDVTENEYVEMIRLKTAILLGASLKSGAMIGGASEKDCNRLYDVGINLGLAFQIQDDLLDVFGDPLIFGKKIGSDILCNKKTYLLVNALSTSGGKEKKELLFWLNAHDKGPEKIKAVTDLYTRLHVKEKAREKMNQYYDKAIQAFQSIDVEENKKSVLMNLADELMDRES
ncbi:MAG: polyprenyl synthetase family protein [Dysgonamonadaceae bacterium]|jgi:geranylgeranyl diphosphate synthase type II|nr:polyprenyl synthetase family protein [Dysgonamonadaceae bacterium]